MFKIYLGRDLVRGGLILLVAGAVALLAFTGCGGSDDSTLSKEDFTAQLKTVCNEGRQAREKFVNDLSKEYYEERAQRATPEYQAENLRKLMAVVQETTDEIAAVGLPQGEEKKVEDWIRMREEAAAKVEASPLGTRDNLQALFEESSKTAGELGVGRCDL